MDKITAAYETYNNYANSIKPLLDKEDANGIERIISLTSHEIEILRNLIAGRMDDWNKMWYDETHEEEPDAYTMYLIELSRARLSRMMDKLKTF